MGKNNKLIEEAIDKIERCNSVDNMKEVYNSYPSLKNDKLLIAKINNKAKELQEGK